MYCIHMFSILVLVFMLFKVYFWAIHPNVHDIVFWLVVVFVRNKIATCPTTFGNK